MIRVSPRVKAACAVLGAAAIVCVAARPARAQQNETTFEETSMLTYTKGQPVIPAYEGWHPLPDGRIELWFGYLNENYYEEPDVAVGPNNTVTAPYGPD